MLGRVKVGKIGGVLFLTVLIWVWADLALERPLPLNAPNLRMAPASDPTLAAAFVVNGELTRRTSLNQVVLIGPEATIRNVERLPGEKLSFVLAPEELGLSQPGRHTVALLDFLRQSARREGRLAGLTVDACQPESLTVQIERLEKATVPVLCIDPRNVPVENASVEPAEVEMFVPQSWGVEQRRAWVTLTDAEVERARAQPSPVQKKPYVQILGQRQEADTTVRVSTPDIEQRLAVAVVASPKLGFVLSPNLQNRYAVVMDQRNLTNALAAIKLRATVEARLAYEKSLYHVLLEVQDKDAEVEQVGPRRLRYNLPPEFVGTGQIRLDQDPVSVTFKLVPKDEAAAESTANG